MFNMKFTWVMQADLFVKVAMCKLIKECHGS